jgi:predicted NBD/HSP70 family sugar kinase/predicted transcriptional regulator
MTQNEKIILSLLKRYGGMGKPKIAEEGGMSWATAVKMTKRLEQEGFIQQGGTAVRSEQKGKNAYLYRLNPKYPLAVGIDIEYKTTRGILTNLIGEELDTLQIDTPSFRTYDELGAFAAEITSQLTKGTCGSEKLAGIGIGMPWIGLAVDSDSHFINKKLAEETISRAVTTSVAIENNTRAYAFYERWINRTLPDEDFIFISIRSGVGTGIFLGGELLNGDQGLAGEIGHLVVQNEGKLCRCGNRGCLETVVNQEVLYGQYMEKLAGSRQAYGPPPNKYEALKDLFNLAADNISPAVEIIDEAVEQLLKGIAPLAATLNIRKGVISGHFGPAGTVLAEKLNRRICNYTLPGLRFNLSYSDFDPTGHTQGAALLVMNQYLSW